MSGHDGVTAGIDSVRSEVRDKSLLLIDVRRADEYRRDHISSAVSLPLAEILSDDGPESVRRLAQSAGIGDETRVAVYDDTFGALSSRVAWALEYIGHSDVRLLETTYGTWKSMGLECDSAVPDVRAKDHSVSLQPDMLATADHLGEARDRDGVVVIDNRERLNYLERHIPGAISIPYRTLADRDMILRPKEDLLRLFGSRGIARDSEIITYCGSVGTLSGLAYYALKSSGMTDTRLYARSFKEWKDLQRPTAGQEDANYWDLSAE